MPIGGYTSLSQLRCQSRNTPTTGLDSQSVLMVGLRLTAFSLSAARQVTVGLASAHSIACVPAVEGVHATSAHSQNPGSSVLTSVFQQPFCISLALARQRQKQTHSKLLHSKPPSSIPSRAQCAGPKEFSKLGAADLLAARDSTSTIAPSKEAWHEPPQQWKSEVGPWTQGMRVEVLLCTLGSVRVGRWCGKGGSAHPQSSLLY